MATSTPRHPPFRFIEVCAGAGMLGVGLKLAFKSLGHSARAVGYIERDVYAASALVARMEDQAVDHAPIWSDLNTFDGRPWRGLVEAVTAGIPCQGNSTAGLRKLNTDPRNLWPATRRLLRQVDPPWFILENVYGFLIPNRKQGLEAPVGRVLGELAEDGWDAEWEVVSAAEVGGSHRRDRIFIVARNRRREDGRLSSIVADALRNERDRRPDGHEVPQQPPIRAAEHAHPGVDSIPLFAPGPSELGRLAAALSLAPALAPAVEPEVRRMDDGLATRLVRCDSTTRPDEVRLVGNGVCPLAAAVAIRRLLARFGIGSAEASTPPTPPPPSVGKKATTNNGRGSIAIDHRARFARDARFSDRRSKRRKLRFDRSLNRR